MVQGAKEQAMINIAINKALGNNLKTTWIDVKKAFDSVDHSYLIECIEKLNFPPWIYPFLKSTIERWKIDIKLNNKTILEKHIKRGILQGDSLASSVRTLYGSAESEVECHIPQGSDQN